MVITCVRRAHTLLDLLFTSEIPRNSEIKANYEYRLNTIVVIVWKTLLTLGIILTLCLDLTCPLQEPLTMCGY